MTCSKCDSDIYAQGKCNRHYFYDLWLENENIYDLGIIKFAKAIVPEWVRNEPAEHHMVSYKAYLRMYKPECRDKYDRLLAEIGYRGSSKTTRSKIILLFVCCYGLEKLAVYCANTAELAINDVNDVKNELSSNERIRYYFGAINSREVEGQEGEWKKNSFRTSTGVTVIPRGVGQPIRSLLRAGYRPTLALINDMYQKDDVKTEYTRSQFLKWFFEDMFNAIDDIDGKIFFNGTILHQDTVPVKLKENSYWNVLEFPVMDVDDFHRVIKEECKETETKIVLPSDARINELEETVKLAWKERFSLRYILRKYAEAFESAKDSSHDTVAGFYQEYFHIVTPPGQDISTIRQVPMNFFRDKGRNWLAVKFSEDNEVVYEVNVFLGVDVATATSQMAKYSVILVAMMNSNRQVFIYSYSRGKYGHRDKMREGLEKKDGDIVSLNRAELERLGIVDEHIRLVKEFDVLRACIETVQSQQNVFDEVVRLMRKNDAYHQVIGVKPTTEKIERDANVLLPYIQSASIYYNLGLPELMSEHKFFPRGKTVDIIDAEAMAVSIATPSGGASYDEVKKKNKKQLPEYTTSFVVL